jgi:hypothetical protein
MTMKSIDFIVDRNDPDHCKTIETPLPDADALPPDALLVKVDRFAFTANNITYALLGDQLKYWQMFPAPPGFGIIPAWGFGDVVASRHPLVATGERLFGIFPMATHLLIEAGDVSKRGLRDATPHREGMAPVYNAYARVGGNPAFAGRNGDQQALLRPLFMLSFLVDDYLAGNGFFGADRVILSSASSKTAFGLAHLLHARGNGLRVIGLTSLANGAFVRSLGCYDDIIAYDAIETLDATSPAVFVDMAGNADIRARLHRHLGDSIKHSIRIGMTHQDGDGDVPDLPGPKPAWFFAPDQIRKRAREWGPGGIESRLGASWQHFAPLLDRALPLVDGRGPDAVRRVYLDTLRGRIPPDQGHMLAMTV